MKPHYAITNYTKKINSSKSKIVNPNELDHIHTGFNFSLSFESVFEFVLNEHVLN